MPGGYSPWMSMGPTSKGLRSSSGAATTRTTRLRAGPLGPPSQTTRSLWSLGAVWAKPINRAFRDQYGIETYWKILLAEDLWVTPDLQLIFKPTYNTTKNVLAVGGIKLRFFF